MSSSALIDALARRLAEKSVGLYDPAGGVMSDDWSVFPDQLPQAPRRAIAITTYEPADDDDSANPWSETRVQIRVRGDADPNVSRAKADAVYDALHGLGMVYLHGGLWLQLAYGRTPAPMGPDAAGAHEHVINFVVSWDNPTEHRPAYE